MKNLSGRISENILFSVLILAVAGWMAGSVASTSAAASPAPQACVAAHGAASSIAAAPAPARCVA
jgi:hypothetical protein